MHLLLNTCHTNTQGRPSLCRFEAKLILDYIFFKLVKYIWSSFIKRSHTYQLTRKTHLLRQANKNWRRNRDMSTG